MAAKTEVERMVASLVGDTSQYVKSMNEATYVTNTVTKTVESSSKEVEGFYKTVESFATATKKGLDEVGGTQWFQGLSRDVEVAGNAMKMFGTKFTENFTKVVRSTGIVDSFKNIWDRMSGILAGFSFQGIVDKFKAAWAMIVANAMSAFAAIKAGVAATSAFIMASPLAFAALAAAVVVGVALIVAAVINLRAHMKEVDDEIERSYKIHANATAAYNKETAQIIEMANLTPGVKGKSKFLFGKMVDISGQGTDEFGIPDLSKLEQAQEKVEEAQKKVNALQNPRNIFRNNLGGALGPLPALVLQLPDMLGLSKDAKLSANELKVANEELERMEKRLNDIAEQFKGTEALKAIREARLETEGLGRAVGLTTQQAKIANLEYKVQQDLFAAAALWESGNEDMMAQSMDLYEAVKNARSEIAQLHIEMGILQTATAIQKVRDDTKDLTKSLEESIVAAQMTTEQFKLWKLEKAAAAAGTFLSDEEVANIKDLMEAHTAVDNMKKLKQEAEELGEKFKAATDKYEDGATKLDAMLLHGLISQTVYDKGLEDLAKKFREAEQAASGAGKEIAKFDATLVGSAEHMARSIAYLEKLNLRNIKPPTVTRQYDKALLAPDSLTPEIMAVKQEEKQTKWLEMIYNVLIDRNQDPDATADELIFQVALAGLGEP